MLNEKDLCGCCGIENMESWQPGNCCYQHGDMPPGGLPCIRCREVADVFEKLCKEDSHKNC